MTNTPAEQPGLAPHQERVVTEKMELDDKRQKLDAFIEGPFFCTLPAAERGRLLQQKSAMHLYSCILSARIEAFES